jgi:hypothetical protein
MLLADLLGRSQAEIESLAEAAVIGFAPLTPRGVRRPSLDEQVRQGRMQRYETDYAQQIRRQFGISER